MVKLSIIINQKIYIMQQKFFSLMRWPGGENEGGVPDSKNEALKADDAQPEATDKSTDKGFIGKVKDALREWSNNDQQEQDIDDATP
jgi:hypothetical protein